MPTDSPNYALMVNVRHDLDAAQVAAQVQTRIENLEKLRVQLRAQELAKAERALTADAQVPREGWSAPLRGVDYVDKMIDDRIRQEQEHFAKVRIIELAGKVPRFVLVYGEDEDATVTVGTGPFQSVEMAAKYFIRGGR